MPSRSTIPWPTTSCWCVPAAKSRGSREWTRWRRRSNPYKITLAPKGAGTFYYLCRLEVSTLNDTDLREVEEWLKGEVQPAVSGRGDITSAVVRGAQRMLVRIAGLPRLTLEARSETVKK